MPQRNPRTWGGARRGRGLRGAVQRRYKNWIRDLYNRSGPGAPFTLHQMMDECGTDFDDKKDYQKAQVFMMNMRKDFATVMQTFFTGPDYERHRAEGMTDPQMFRKLTDAALSVDVYPVWADPKDQHKYKLFDLTSFAYIMQVRARSIVIEVERKANTLGLAFSKLPELRDLYPRPALQGDGVLLELPPGVECPVCHEHIGDPVAFVGHYNIRHAVPPPGPSMGGGAPPSGPASPPTCPICKVPLGQMEGGDYICRECKQVFDKDKL